MENCSREVLRRLGPDVASNSFSVAKSYISVLTGIACGKAHHRCDDPVGNYLPEFAEGRHADITLYHLLTMSTGLTGARAAPILQRQRQGLLRLQRAGTEHRPALPRPARHRVRLHQWQQCQVMAEVLETAYGRNLLDLVQEKISDPCSGCEDTAWWGRTAGAVITRPSAACTPPARFRPHRWLTWTTVCGGHAHRARGVLPGLGDPAPVGQGQPNRRYGYFWWLAELDGGLSITAGASTGSTW